VLLVCRLEVEVIIIFIPAHEFVPASTVDAELHFQTNRAVRPDPLGQHDLVHKACEFYGVWLLGWGLGRLGRFGSAGGLLGQIGDTTTEPPLGALARSTAAYPIPDSIAQVIWFLKGTGENGKP